MGLVVEVIEIQWCVVYVFVQYGNYVLQIIVFGVGYMYCVVLNVCLYFDFVVFDGFDDFFGEVI